MRIILTILFATAFFAAPAMAGNVHDDGGFGSTRFSAQTPVALGGQAQNNNVVAVVPPTSPADIEPAAGEEDITPEADTLENGKVVSPSVVSEDEAD